MTVSNVLLSGVVGSVAYGLATEDSDTDRLGVFVTPTEKLLGLHPPEDSVVSTDPDVTFHEAGKYVRLALKCNPTVTELLWLPEHEVTTGLGEDLIAIRKTFLSQAYVRNAYLGYATAQFRRLENRSAGGDHSFSSDTKKRTAKHARHLARLLHQGIGLWDHGDLYVKLADPEWFRDFGEKVAAGDLDLARNQLALAELFFSTQKTSLPEHPDEGPAEAWLQKVRREYY